jgi:hypothetical protein
MAVQSNNVYPPLVPRGFYFCVSAAADNRYSIGDCALNCSNHTKVRISNNDFVALHHTLR